MKTRLASTVRDALYYTHPHGGSVDLGRGAVIGVTACLMAERGMEFKAAFALVVANLPQGYRVDCIPEPWRELL